MNFIYRFLVKTGIIRIKTSWLERKIVRKDINALEFALETGLYDIREMAARHLGKLESKVSKEKLIRAMDDPVPAVSEAAMQALEKIDGDTSLTRSIEQKRAYWKALALERKTRDRSAEKKYMPERKDRPSRKSFENLKQMLRKPMNSGKWF